MIELNRVKKRLDRLQDVIVDLTAQLRFFRRENNLLKAKLLQWENDSNRVQCQSCGKKGGYNKGKRNYSGLKVRGMMTKHRDEDWNTIKNSEVNIDLNRW